MVTYVILMFLCKQRCAPFVVKLKLTLNLWGRSQDLSKGEGGGGFRLC